MPFRPDDPTISSPVALSLSAMLGPDDTPVTIGAKTPHKACINLFDHDVKLQGTSPDVLNGAADSQQARDHMLVECIHQAPRPSDDGVADTLWKTSCSGVAVHDVIVFACYGPTAYVKLMIRMELERRVMKICK